MKQKRLGQSIVEMAMIVPLFFIFIAGIIDGGYYVYTYTELENAARRGSEWAYTSPPTTIPMVDDNTGDKCALLIKDEVRRHVFFSNLTLDNITVSYPDPAQQRRDVGVPIQVGVKYTANWLTPLGTWIFGPNIKFDFSSRRTIVNITPPADMNDGCT